MTTITKLYTDGGLLGNNGDEGLLGVYAWVQVGEQGQYIAHATGVVRPFGDKRVENNMVELVALLRGLRSLPDGWSGYVASDNRLALGWAFARFRNINKVCNGNFTTENLPPSLASYILCCRKRLGEIDAEHLDGHPTAEELECGIGHGGDRVSVWNQFADDHCNAYKLTFAMTELGMTPQEANKKYHMKAEHHARLLPSVQDALKELGYPLEKKSRKK